MRNETSLHMIASVLYDGPITRRFVIDGSFDDLESYLEAKGFPFGLSLEYIGYSTGNIDSPDPNVLLYWYTSELPCYLSLGTDAYVLCLAHFDDTSNNIDYIDAYIGSSRAIDSVTRRYSYSFHRVEESFMKT